MNKFNSVVWFEIYVDDMARAKKFYERLLQIELSELPTPIEDPMQMMSFPGDMEAGGASGALVKMEGFDAGGGGTLVYFHSEDCGIEQQRIAAAGGELMRPKTSLGEFGFMVLGKDTEGNMFGFHSMK